MYFLFSAKLLPVWAILVCSSLAKFKHMVPPYYPHPTDCSKYVLRDWNVEVIFDCQTGLHWNDGKKTCDYPWRAGCSAQLQAMVMPTEYYIKCPDEVNIAIPVYMPHIEKSKFFMCSASELMEFSCDPDCVFNIQMIRCECFQGVRTSPALPTITTQVNTRTTPLMPGNCPSVIEPKNPVFYPHSNCDMFYVCTLKGLVETRCHDGFHWSATRSRCERPWDAGCINMGSISAETSTISVRTTSNSNDDVIAEDTNEEPTSSDDLTTTDT